MLSLGLTNIFADGRFLFLFHRVGNNLQITKETTFFPYFYEKSDSGIFRGYFGERLTKIHCNEPWKIPEKRTINSREADILYTKRYLLDKVNITKANLRYVFFDIETQSKDLPDAFKAPDPISCITTYDNYTQEYKTFWALDFKTEYDLINAFVLYIKKIQPDLMLAYNAYNFDFPYLINRFPDFSSKISPIGKEVKRNHFPAGISILDYYELVKKIYKFKRYTLDFVYCDTFKIESTLVKPDFSKLTEELRKKNQDDVRKMVELEQKFHLISYFDELRRLGKVLWEDLTQYSVLVDGFILQVAKEKNAILPTKPDEAEKLRRQEEDEIIGGYVYAKPGLYENVHLFDVGGTYPNLIVTFNLDPVNKRQQANTQTTTVHGVHIQQNPSAIVPSVCSRLINSRKEIQKKLESVTGEAYDLLKQQDAAHKSLNNTVYGILLFRGSRLYDKDIASTITYLARFLIRYTKWCLRKFGLEVVASDTDSIFVKTELPYSDVENTINTIIIPKWLKHFGKDTGTLRFKYEGTFDNLFMLTKKHYIGNMTKDKETKKIIKGIEVLRSDSSTFQEEFQETLLDKILSKESEDSITNWIKTEVERMRQSKLIDISFPGRLSKSVDEYKTDAIHLRALRYAQEANPEWKVRIGQNYYYCFIQPTTEESKMATRKIKGETKEVEVKKAMDVWAFDEFTGIGTNAVDWNRMIERNIYKKAEAIFEAMHWNIDTIHKICYNYSMNTTTDSKKGLITTSEATEKVAQDTKRRKKESSAVDNPSVSSSISHTELAKQFEQEINKKFNKCTLSENVSPKVDTSKEQTFNISHSFKTKAEITDRTIMVAEAFGLGIDDEKTFQIYDNVELKVKSGDIIYITGDSGSGKSWMLNNIFAKMQNAISINELKIDDNEVVVEGVGKDLNDALMKLNVAGLGDAFLYLRKYSQLSDGQKYRYRIAKFIDQENKNIWILDEFCATLDRVTAKVVAYNLQKIARKLNKTVVVATTHEDLYNEIRPSVYIKKGYESDVEIKYIGHNADFGELEFYKDIKVEKGQKEDYEKLKRFHYRQASLGALKQVYTCTYKNEVIGVIVICYPHLALKGRNVALNNRFSKMTKETCTVLNNEFDSIARVIIHPKFRGIGLAQVMLQKYFQLTDATYVETLAVMANYNPFFEKAGMIRIDTEEDTKRITLVNQLTAFGFNTSLLSSARYCESIFLALNDDQKVDVREIVQNILSKYKGQIAKLFSKDTSIEDIVENHLFEAMGEIQRANTVYLIKKLK